MAEGMDPQQACRQAGVPHYTYRRWVIDNPESIRIMEKTISAMEREALMEITHAASTLLTQIVGLSTRTDLPPRTQLDVHRYLEGMKEDLVSKQGTGTREDIRAKEFLLTGPKTHKAESRTTTVNIKPMADGSVDVTVMKAEDIIDAITPEGEDQHLSQET